MGRHTCHGCPSGQGQGATSSLKAAVEFTPRALSDWKRIDDRNQDRIAREIELLRTIPPPANIDERPLEGHKPWRRLRVGDPRLIFRLLAMSELKARGWTGKGYLVERVIARRDLERATKGLR